MNDTIATNIRAGSSRPSARLTSCTPSVSEDAKNGVSVENVHMQFVRNLKSTKYDFHR